MLKYLLAMFFCMHNKHAVVHNNQNAEKIVSDFLETDSPLSQKLEERKVWDLYRQKPAEADRQALNTLHELYAYESLYGEYTHEDYQEAWNIIKNEHQPLQRLPVKKKSSKKLLIQD